MYVDNEREVTTNGGVSTLLTVNKILLSLHLSKAHTPLDFGLRWVSKLWWKFGCTTPWKIQATDVIFQTDNVGRTGLKEKA